MVLLGLKRYNRAPVLQTNSMDVVRLIARALWGTKVHWAWEGPGCRRRLEKELTSLQGAGAIPVVKVDLADADLFIWKLTITGPSGSPYAGGEVCCSS